MPQEMRWTKQQQQKERKTNSSPSEIRRYFEATSAATLAVVAHLLPRSRGAK